MPVDDSRQLIEQHLAQAEKDVALGLAHIEQQRRILSELKKGNHDTAAAEELLQTFLETQVLHQHDRDRLRGEIGLP